MGKAARKTAALKALARQWTPFERVTITDAMRQEHPVLLHCTSIFANSRIEAHLFEVHSEIGGLWQANFVRHGNIEPLSWEEIQRSVHEIFGPECCAVEVYPPIAEEWQTNLGLRIVWILPTTFKVPFSFSNPCAWGKPAHV